MPARSVPWKLLVRVLILALVAWGVTSVVLKARADFARHQFSPADLDLGWLIAAAGLYLAGIAPCALFWHRTLWKMGQRPSRWETFRAYFVGNLGKYVPGKAMVVVLRTGLIRGPQVSTAVAVASVFVETLTMMAVGACLSAVILTWLRSEPWLLGLSTGLLVCAGLPTVPRLFRVIVAMLQRKRTNEDLSQSLAGLDWPLMGYGWLVIGTGWWLVGLSLWATLRAIPGVDPQVLASFSSVALVTACVALAIVAGFVSLLPGGVGVRELVVMTLLVPVFGHVPAIVSAIVLRLVWLVAELAVAGLLYVLPRSPEHGLRLSRERDRAV